MPRFSLRQIFLAVFALAIGFSIWRLPKGDWIDVPLAALGCYFVLSLCRHAVATRRLLIDQSPLPRPQRWGGRILVVELLGAAIALVVALVFRYLAAAEILLKIPDSDFEYYYVRFPTLPRDLAVLAMLAATGLESWRSSPAMVTPWRQKVNAAIGMGGMLIGVIAYWADRMLVWFLVYLALSGVEAAWPPRLLPPEMNVSTAVRIQRFTLGSLAGLTLVIANLLLIAGLVKWWTKPRTRSMFVISLGAGLVAECWSARWIAVQGLRQLSIPFQEAIQVPPFGGVVVAVAMILFAGGAFTWRTLAKQPPVDQSRPVPERLLYFHEHWLCSLLLGVVATAAVAITLIIDIIARLNSPYASQTINLQMIIESLTHYPTQLIWLAAALGGCALAWMRWRRRKEAVSDTLPFVNPALFAVTMLSLLIVVVASAPIVAAVSFSYWFVQFGTVF